MYLRAAEVAALNVGGLLAMPYLLSLMMVEMLIRRQDPLYGL